MKDKLFHKVYEAVGNGRGGVREKCVPCERLLGRLGLHCRFAMFSATRRDGQLVGASSWVCFHRPDGVVGSFVKFLLAGKAGGIAGQDVLVACRPYPRSADGVTSALGVLL